MFLENKYTLLYYKIIKGASNNIKEPNDGKQYHHIIPKCMGGTDDPTNLVLLTYKQHRVVHRLLINMTEGNTRIKLSYAYSMFGKSAGNYLTGKDNNFSKPHIIEIVRSRMMHNNPMKTPEQRARMRKTNHRNKAIMTPAGKFISRAAALRHYNFKHWKVLYDLMEEHPEQYYWITSP